MLMDWLHFHVSYDTPTVNDLVVAEVEVDRCSKVFKILPVILCQVQLFTSFSSFSSISSSSSPLFMSSSHFFFICSCNLLNENYELYFSRYMSMIKDKGRFHLLWRFHLPLSFHLAHFIPCWFICIFVFNLLSMLVLPVIFIPCWFIYLMIYLPVEIMHKVKDSACSLHSMCFIIAICFIYLFFVSGFN